MTRKTYFGNARLILGNRNREVLREKEAARRRKKFVETIDNLFCADCESTPRHCLPSNVSPTREQLPLPCPKKPNPIEAPGPLVPGAVGDTPQLLSADVVCCGHGPTPDHQQNSNMKASEALPSKNNQIGGNPDVHMVPALRHSRNHQSIVAGQQSIATVFNPHGQSIRAYLLSC